MQNPKRKLKINPALQIVMGFFALIVLGTFVLCLPVSSASGTWTGFVDSFFTSTSAVCVTGLIVVDTAIHWSLFGQIVILLLIQIGGLGFIALTSLIFLVLGKKISYNNRIAIQESLNKQEIQGVVKLVKRVIILVLSIELVGILCIAPSLIPIYGWGDGLFKSTFLSISSFCNAGFDVLGTSATPFSSLSAFAQNSLLLLPIMFLVVVGGIGYMVLFDIGAKFGKNKKISFHSKLVLYITAVLVFGGAFLFALFEWNNPATIGNMGFGDKIVNSFFQSITSRSAGFATYDMANLTPASKLLTSVFMLIGGSPASTAGGIKTTTIFVLVVSLFRQANDKGDIVIFKRQISNRLIRKAMRVLFLYLTIMLLSALTICAIEGSAVALETVVFEVISAMSTGVTMGITSTISLFSKLVLIAVMFVGRVGVVTLIVALSGKSRNNADIEYPDSKIIVG